MLSSRMKNKASNAVHGWSDIDATVIYFDLYPPLFLLTDLGFDTRRLHTWYLQSSAGATKKADGTLALIDGTGVFAYWAGGENAIAKAISFISSYANMIRRESRGELNRSGVEVPAEVYVEIHAGIAYGQISVLTIPIEGYRQPPIMGNVVNLASRLKEVNRAYSTKVIISETIKGNLEESAMVRELDSIRVLGKTEPMTIYELLDS